MGETSNTRLLYIENEPLLRDQFEKAVDPLGYSLEFAQNGKEGLAQYAETPYDVVAVAIRLPDMSGTVIAQSLLSEKPELPLLLVTGRRDEPLAVEALGLGVVSYVIEDQGKINLALIPSILRSMLERAGQMRKRIEIERTLRETEARLNEAQRIAGFGSWDRDLQTNEIWWSDEVYRIFGVTRKLRRLSLEDFLSFIHPVVRERFAKIRKRAIEEGGEFDVTLRILQQTGSERVGRFNGVVTRDSSGEPRRLSGTVQDLTERNRTEELLAMIIESIPEGLAYYDADDRLVLANSKMKDCYPLIADKYVPGATYEEITRIGIERGQFAPPEGASEAWIQKVLAHHRDPKGAIEYQLDDGRFVRVEERRTSNGGIVGVRTDLTENKKIELALEEAKNAAEQSNRAKSEFLASMSHDLRTPLNSILGFSEAMVQGIYGRIGDPHYEEYAELIHQSGQYLVSLINDILDLSKIESGEYALDEILIDVEEALNGSLQRCTPTFVAGSNPRVSIDIDGGSSHLFADQRALSQILDNLLSNAIKYSGPQARIVLRWSTNGEGEGTLQVSDTGPGIPAERLDKITQPFVQGSFSVSDNPHIAKTIEGVGLGLHIVLRLADLHQASLSIESVVGEGTVAAVTFPKGRVRLAH